METKPYISLELSEDEATILDNILDYIEEKDLEAEMFDDNEELIEKFREFKERVEWVM